MVDGTTLSPNTINRRLNAVKALVKATAALGHLDTGLAYEFSLVEKCKVATLRTRLNPHTRRLLTPAQVRALCLAPNPSTFSGLRDRALLYTLASSGCRISELATLQRTHIVPLGPSWGLTVLGKGQATERLAPLAPDAYHWIQRWLAKRDAVLTSAWVFTACDYGRPDHPVGHPLTPQTIGSRVKRYARQIGLPHISAHHLRKFCGTQIAQKFGPRQGQKALGHKLFATFETYYLLDQLEGGLSDDLF
jgi:integrase